MKRDLDGFEAIRRGPRGRMPSRADRDPAPPGADPERRPGADPDPRPVVEVLGPPEKVREIVGLLGRLNRRILLRREDGAGRASPQPAALASILVEEDDDRLADCARLSPDRPVILVSPRSGFAFRAAAARAGVRAVMRSPVDPIELTEWLGQFGLHEDAAPAISVVMVDDDALTAELNAEVLRAAGIEVEIVCDPTLALEAIERRLPDLVIMDLHMPEIGGVDLARIVRQSRQFAHLPIVFLSIEGDEGRQFEARMLGGDDFIAKDIDPAKLVARVRMRAERAKLLRSMIERDGLTGVYDRRRFRERLSQELERCRRSGAELCLAMVDIDRFKAVNDTHGHATGDVVIRILASALTGGVRQVDVVGRYGGEEFGVILVETGQDAAKAAIDRVRDQFAATGIPVEGSVLAMTFSAGVVSSRLCGDLDRILDAADRALYEAKRAGRNRVATAAP